MLRVPADIRSACDSHFALSHAILDRTFIANTWRSGTETSAWPHGHISHVKCRWVRTSSDQDSALTKFGGGELHEASRFRKTAKVLRNKMHLKNCRKIEVTDLLIENCRIYNLEMY
jgi:hypothetical protein